MDRLVVSILLIGGGTIVLILSIFVVAILLSLPGYMRRQEVRGDRQLKSLANICQAMTELSTTPKAEDDREFERWRSKHDARSG